MALENLPELLTVDELAQVLRIGRSSAYQLVRAGEIRRVEGLGRTIRIRRADVERFIGGGPAAQALRAAR